MVTQSSQTGTDIVDQLDGTVTSYLAMKASLTNITQKPPKVWAVDSLNSLRENLRPTTEDVLGLTHGSSHEDTELVDGMALEYQWIRCGEGMDPHSHAWWHLFFVISGEVVICFGGESERHLRAGDVAFVPPKIPHGFRNDDPVVDAVMYSLTNKAALARTGQFVKAVPAALD